MGLEDGINYRPSGLDRVLTREKVEGELRYREFQPKSSAAKVHTAEIHAISILTLYRAEKTEHEGETAAAELTGDDDTPF